MRVHRSATSGSKVCVDLRVLSGGGRPEQKADRARVVVSVKVHGLVPGIPNELRPFLVPWALPGR